MQLDNVLQQCIALVHQVQYADDIVEFGANQRGIRQWREAYVKMRHRKKKANNKRVWQHSEKCSAVIFQIS